MEEAKVGVVAESVVGSVAAVADVGSAAAGAVVAGAAVGSAAAVTGSEEEAETEEVGSGAAAGCSGTS
jgi:hypothetical protein